MNGYFDLSNFEFQVFPVFLQDEPVALGPNPPNLLSKQLEFLPPVIYDEHPMGRPFGEVVRHPMKSYKAVSCYSDLI